MIPLEIIHSDSHVAVLIKPAGISCHGKSSNSMIRRLQRENLQELFGWDANATAHLVHRLDHGTRGPLMVASSADMAHRIQALWPSFHKTYHAWVAGELSTTSGLCRFSIGQKQAHSRFQSLGSRTWAMHEHATLVEWTIRTGRTHQIRRHASALGHPVVGDPVYFRNDVYTGHGLFLQCTALEWTHPVTGESHQSICFPSKKMKRAHHSSFLDISSSPFAGLFSRERRQADNPVILPTS